VAICSWPSGVIPNTSRQFSASCGVDRTSRAIGFSGDTLRPVLGEEVEGGDRSQILLIGEGQPPARRNPLAMQEGVGGTRPAGRGK